MTNFRPNHAGIGEMLNRPAMVRHMQARANKIAAAARQAAPFDPNSKDGTHYKDSFTVSAQALGGIHHDRAEAKVTNDDAAAFYIEYGTRKTTRHRTLGKAIDAARS
jgi:regulator of protease activity HflC (stomatin/prohibitin superfamily)